MDVYPKFQIGSIVTVYGMPHIIKGAIFMPNSIEMYRTYDISNDTVFTVSCDALCENNTPITKHITSKYDINEWMFIVDSEGFYAKIISIIWDGYDIIYKAIAMYRNRNSYIQPFSDCILIREQDYIEKLSNKEFKEAKNILDKWMHKNGNDYRIVVDISGEPRIKKPI